MLSTSQVAFQATLAQPLNFGHTLEICGKVNPEANSIKINFGHLKSTADATNQNEYLQIHMDFMEKQITFSQFDSTEKGNTSVKTKLVLAEFLNEFKFYIMLAETKFHIALNNKKLLDLKYQLNLTESQIQTLNIMGKLEYLKQLDHHKYFPHIWPPIQIVEDYLDFSSDQPMSFEPGHIIAITATLEGNNKGRFLIHFRHARDNKRQELHVSVRFDTKKIIRNSKCRQADDNLAFDEEEVDGFAFISSRFGQEEIDNLEVFPFEDFSKPFKLAIALCETEFRFAKDGKFLFNYTYRSPNILRYIMGPKLFGTNGVNVRVRALEHFPLKDDQLCQDFEKYSV